MLRLEDWREMRAMFEDVEARATGLAEPALVLLAIPYDTDRARCEERHGRAAQRRPRGASPDSGAAAMRDRPLRGLLLCAPLLTLVGACAAQPLPNVLIVVVDTLRRDHLGAYGYSRDTSPRIDRLAADAVRYEAAQSHAPWTLPSVAAVLTGRDVAPLGILDDEDVLGPEHRLLSEVLSEQGWVTGAVVSHKFVSAKWGFDQGFDFFDDSQARGHMAVTSHEVTDRALAFLDAHRDQRFFLFLHYFDPHFSYVEHEGFRFERSRPYEGWIQSGTRFKKLMRARRELTEADMEELRRLYDSEIAFTDHHIGRLLDHLRERGLYENTLIVITADHGEEFLEHGQIGHGKTLYEELVGVPLVVRFPGRRPGVVESPVALVDVFPTVLELAGVERPTDLDGVSLLEPEAERVVFSSTSRRGGSRGARSGRYKLIRRVREGAELYDLGADPDERSDLLRGGRTPPAGHERMREALAPYAARVDAAAPRRVRVELSAEERRQLQELGYLGADESEDEKR